MFIYMVCICLFIGKVCRHFLQRTLAKHHTCQKKRKSSSNEPKLKSKRPKRSTNPDENYGHADPLENLKDVKDEQFINEMNEFVRYILLSNKNISIYISYYIYYILIYFTYLESWVKLIV